MPSLMYRRQEYLPVMRRMRAILIRGFHGWHGGTGRSVLFYLAALATASKGCPRISAMRRR